MPKGNVERAIRRAQASGGAGLEETVLEGYGPGGVAVLVECATDNNTRTVASVRHLFQKHGGSLGKEGDLRFVFEQRAVFTVPAAPGGEDELALRLIDMGAEEVEPGDGALTVVAPMREFGAMQERLEAGGVAYTDAGLHRAPLVVKEPPPGDARRAARLVEALEDEEDVQRVYHNMGDGAAG